MPYRSLIIIIFIIFAAISGLTQNLERNYFSAVLLFMYRLRCSQLGDGLGYIHILVCGKGQRILLLFIFQLWSPIFNRFGKRTRQTITCIRKIHSLGIIAAMIPFRSDHSNALKFKRACYYTSTAHARHNIRLLPALLFLNRDACRSG